MTERLHRQDPYLLEFEAGRRGSPRARRAAGQAIIPKLEQALRQIAALK